MATKTQIPDNPHDLAQAIAKSARLKDAEIADPPSKDYARIRRDGKTLAYVMLRGRKAATGEGGGDEAATAKPVKDPIALHHSGRIHRYSSVTAAAKDVKKLAAAE